MKFPILSNTHIVDTSVTPPAASVRRLLITPPILSFYTHSIVRHTYNMHGFVCEAIVEIFQRRAFNIDGYMLNFRSKMPLKWKDSGTAASKVKMDRENDPMRFFLNVSFVS